MDTKTVKQSIKNGDYKIKKKIRDETGKLRKFSGIWKTFFQIWKTEKDKETNVDIEILVTGFVCCSKCHHVMRYNTLFGTTSILKHADKHNDSNNELAVPSVNCVPASGRKALLNSCINFVSKDLRPYKAVEDAGFLDLIQTAWNLGAEFGQISTEKLVEVLPSRQAVSYNITAKANDIRAQLKIKLNATFEELKSIPMTADIWTDNQKHMSYLGLTAHFYDDEGNLCDQLIALRVLDVGTVKDNVYVRKVIEEILDDYGLKENIKSMVFTTDRGGNIKVALRCSIRLNCIAHMINNIVKAACDIDIVKEQIAQCKTLVTFFKITGLNNTLGTSLKQAIDVRFNSVCNMFESILKNRLKVKDALESRNEDRRIENIHFNQVQCMFAYLDEFRHWSTKGSASKIPTLYLVWIAMDALIKHSTPSNDDNSTVALMKIKAYQYIEENFEIHELHRVATFLHPNFKSLKFTNEQKRMKTHNDTRHLLRKYHPSSARTTNRRESTSSSSSVDSTISTYMDDNSSLLDEVHEYISLKCIPDEKLNLINWWQDRKELFPTLSKLALWIHSIPASSIPSERKFSTAGSILIEKRANLKPDSVENIMLIHSHGKNSAYSI